MHNPFNEDMQDPAKREALYVLEAARHKMSEVPVSNFPITPKLQKWRELTFKKGEPYFDDDKLFRETVVSRALVGDDAGNDTMPLPLADIPKSEIQKYSDLVKGKAAPTAAPAAPTYEERTAPDGRVFRKYSDGRIVEVIKN